MARNQKEWLFAGSLFSGASGRAGRTYPSDEILETIRGLPLCSYCSIVQVPVSGTAADDSLFVLLIFTGARRALVDEAETGKKIRITIGREMGQEFLPDRIQFFPLLPRCDADGNIDHSWCQSQFLNGSLFRKSRQEIYRSLTCLREMVREAPRQGGGCDILE